MAQQSDLRVMASWAMGLLAWHVDVSVEGACSSSERNTPLGQQ